MQQHKLEAFACWFIHWNEWKECHRKLANETIQVSCNIPREQRSISSSISIMSIGIVQVIWRKQKSFVFRMPFELNEIMCAACLLVCWGATRFVQALDNSVRMSSTIISAKWKCRQRQRQCRRRRTTNSIRECYFVSLPKNEEGFIICR